jgi:hypothetical protein
MASGMVERFNGRIEDVLQSHRFQSGEDLEQTILRYVHLYNSQLPQSVLKGRTPINALKDWQRQRPELFRKRACNPAGCDTLVVLEQLGPSGWHRLAKPSRVWRNQRPIKRGDAGGPALRAIGNSRHDSHSRIACAQASAHRHGRIEKR